MDNVCHMPFIDIFDIPKSEFLSVVADNNSPTVTLETVALTDTTLRCARLETPMWVDAMLALLDQRGVARQHVTGIEFYFYDVQKANAGNISFIFHLDADGWRTSDILTWIHQVVDVLSDTYPATFVSSVPLTPAYEDIVRRWAHIRTVNLGGSYGAR